MSSPLRQKTTCVNSGWGKEKGSVRLRTAARLAHLHDPDYGFGIVGALTSGKVSALALRDRDGAQVLFDRMNRNHMYLYYTFEAIARLPQSVKL